MLLSPLRRWILAITAVLAAATPALAQNEAELARLAAAYARELGRVQTHLAWFDQLQQMERAQGRIRAAEAEAKLRARGEELYSRSFSDAELDQVIAQHRAVADGYFKYVEQAVGAAPADQRPALMAQLETRRKQYAAFAGQRLEPLPVLRGTAQLFAYAKGHRSSMPVSFDPFTGQDERILAAIPDPNARRLIAAAATVFGAPPTQSAALPAALPAAMPSPPPTPVGPSPQGPGPTATAPMRIIALDWVAIDADRTGTWGIASLDGRPDGHFRLRLSLAGVQEIISIALHTADAAGNPVLGQHWHSKDRRYWGLAIYFKDRRINPDYLASLGRFRGNFILDLHAADSGYFRPGQQFLVEVETQGETLRRMAQIGAPADPTARPPAMAASPPPVPAELGKVAPAAVISPPAPDVASTTQASGVAVVPTATPARPGPDSTIALPNLSPEACQKLCDQAPGCLAFTYARPGVRGPQALCRLNSRIPE